MSQAIRKLLIVGWDGATFDVIRPMIARGELPHLARLMAEGAHGPLRSTVPPSSAVAWPTFATGRDPAGHGVFGFYQSDDRSYRPRLVSSRDVRAPSLWDWLGQAGYRVGVVNVPITYPPRPVNGFMVTGMLTPAPEETFTYPPGLKTQLLAGPRPYPIEAQVMKQIREQLGQSPAAAIELLHRWTDDFHASVRSLMAEQSWDCYCVVYRATDLVQHFFGFLWNPELVARWPERAAQVAGGIEAIYRQADSCLGELLALLPPETTVMVISDHGFAPAFGRFYLNNWLHQQGYLVLKRGARCRRWLNLERRVPLRRILTRLRLGKLTRYLPARLADMFIPVPATGNRQPHHLIDWRHTRAYMPFSGASGLAVRLNVNGRDPQGIVTPGAEAEALLTELARKLAGLGDSTDRPLFQTMMTAPDNLTGLAANQGPDLVALPNKENYHVTLHRLAPEGGVFAGAPHCAGQHWIEGVLIVSGPAITSGVTLESAGLVDVAPTALHLMGVPAPTEMDGRVLTDALRPEWLAVRPVQTTPEHIGDGISPPEEVYSSEELAQVENALRDLGYLE